MEPVTTHQAQAGRDDRWAHRLGHLLWEVSARTALLGEAELADTPLTLPSMGVLDQVGAEPGITIAEMSRRVPKTQQAISQVVARLEKLGYVERRLGSGRGVALYITDAGVRARAEGHSREDAFEQRLFDLVGEDHYEQLRALLEEARAQLLATEVDT
jgi:DNA-binding MarR family transcriptional regulator